jgi:hypothetical protein
MFDRLGINTILTSALPKSNTLYKVWFRRKLPTYKASKENACRARAVLKKVNKTSASKELSTIKVIKVKKKNCRK